MSKAYELAHSLIGKHRVSIDEVEGKVHNTRLVDDILRQNGYRKVFDRTSTNYKGWAISDRYTKHNEYLV